MAIRALNWGLEAVEGTAAATFVFLPIVEGSFKIDNSQKRDIAKRITGSRWVTQGTRKGPREFKATFQMYLDFDMNCYPMACHFGAPVTVAVPSATGAFTQTFKPGGSSIMSATVQWKGLSGGVSRWKQAVAVKVTQVKIVLGPTGLPMVDYTVLGKYAATISAPGSPPALNAANYVQPDISMQALSLSGSAWSKVKKFDLDSNQGLAHDWTIEATTDPTRIKMGDAGAKLTVQRFLDSYVGSLIEFGESASGRLGQIIATIQGVDSIGTGTPTTTQIVCTVPKPDNTGAKEEATNDDDTESADLEISYDTTLASGFSLMFRNELAAAVFVGS